MRHVPDLSYLSSDAKAATCLARTGKDDSPSTEPCSPAKRGKKGNAARLLALSSGSCGAAKEKRDVKEEGPGRAEGGGKCESPDSSKKAPKKPKKVKVARGAAEDADAKADSSEAQGGRRARGMEKLLAKIKSKGWMKN